MSVKSPSADQIKELADRYNMHLTNADAADYADLVDGVLASYRRLDELAEPKIHVRYPRTAGHRPTPDENPLNAWYWKTKVEGAADGLLKGKRIALKDTTCLAGVPMMNGSAVLEGYVPDVDATIATRILDAGGTIVGKAACEDLCFSGGSHTNYLSPALNPHEPTHSTGGSSSGSAALVSIGEVDMATGGDQGGSVRIPASWCGVYGLKPTYGLVPCTGIFPIEMTLDHCGPICGSTRDVALLLSVIAGRDGMDPRQFDCDTHDYLTNLESPASGLRIAMIIEGFDRPESEPAVDDKVRAAAQRFASLGATVETVSIPMHFDAVHIWTAIIADGAAEMMIKGNGAGTNWQGAYTTSMIDAFARGWHSQPDDLSDTVKLVLFVGEYMNRYYHNRYYAKAQNLRPLLRKAYDDVLEQYDLLLMPTTPMKAQPLPPVDCSHADYVARALEMINNTCPFDASGHPAMSVPCGMVEGLPVGMMIIGRKFDEATVLRASHAFETHADWKTL